MVTYKVRPFKDGRIIVGNFDINGKAYEIGELCTEGEPLSCVFKRFKKLMPLIIRRTKAGINGI